MLTVERLADACGFELPADVRSNPRVARLAQGAPTRRPDRPRPPIPDAPGARAAARALAMLGPLAVSLRDRFEGVAWLDRDEVHARTPLRLGPHEAETVGHVYARALLAAVRDESGGAAGDRLALVRSLEASGSVLAGLAFALLTLEERAADHYPDAVVALDRAIAVMPGDPNLGRLKLRLLDAIQGGEAFERIRRYGAAWTCLVPYEHVNTTPNGAIYLCCSGWMSRSVGHLEAPDFGAEVLSGTAAGEIRRSVADGSYRYCNWLACPALNAQRLERCQPSDRPAPAPAVRRIDLAHDRTCNLACPSCRTAIVASSPERNDHLRTQVGPRLLPLLRTAERIKVTGSGDPFASPHFRELLQSGEIAGRKLHLHTNGTLLTPEMFEACRLRGRVAAVEISMDAATAATYAHVRRGGDFSRLRRNLGFLASLRRDGEIPHLQLDFVVQAANFREIPAFVDLGADLGVDRILFTGLRNWGTFTERDFLEADVCSPRHARFAELLQILADPRVQHPAVDVGSLAHLRSAPSARVP